MYRAAVPVLLAVQSTAFPCSENAVGIVLPVIDTTACIGCHTCEKACPILKTPEPHKPSEAYAAWSSDGAERVTSASGGVAIEMYKHAVANGYAAVGASQNDDFSVTHKLVTSADGLGQFKNSKYVFSDAYDAFCRHQESPAGEPQGHLHRPALSGRCTEKALPG